MKQNLKYILDKLLEQIKIAEQKYSITLALASGVIVLGSSFIGNVNVYIKILASGTVIFSLFSILFGFLALFARHIKIHKKRKPSKSNNLLFYKTIIHFDEFFYIEEMKKRYNFPSSYKPDELDLDLARNVIAQARVVNAKFLYFNLSLFFLMMGVLTAVIMVGALGGL